ncbi:MAG: 50S ribosomal protein L24 [archaeon]|nr:50S ribosomal protein L24 [archaeon]
MPKCSYCKREYDIPRGLTLVMADGKVIYLCSGKCRKNMKMKRRKVNWVTKKKKGEREILIQDIKEKEENSKEK